MNKKITSIFITLAIIILSIIPSFAMSTEPDETYSDIATSTEDTIPFFTDKIGLLSTYEAQSVENELKRISEKQNCNIAIAVVDSTGSSTTEAYADDYYDYTYGGDGVLLLISISDRAWHITTTGSCITYFTDAGIEMIGSDILDYLSQDNYYDAFLEFTYKCDDFITEAKTNRPYDNYNNSYGNSYDGTKSNTALVIAVCVVLGFAIAFIVVFVMKKQLNTVHMQSSASNYMRGDSLNIYVSRDTFLNRHVTRTEIPRNTNYGSGGGGSSTHVGSSGTTHGGGGGHF